MAVLVLKNADFSANYVKKIEIFGGFSETTKAVFNRCGVIEDESNMMQLSVDTFINILVTAGLWGTKIKSLCIPFLSELGANGNLAKAQLNIVDGNNFFKNDIDGSLALSSHGLACVPGGSVVKVNLTDYVTDVSDMHIGGYNITLENVTETTQSGTLANKFLYGSMTGILGLCKCKEGRPSLYLNSGSGGPVGDANYVSASCLLIGSKVNEVNWKLATNGQYVASTLAAQSSSLSDPKFGTYSLNVYTDNPSAASLAMNHFYTKASWSLLTLGTGLTEDEMTTYTNAVNDLMADVATYLA